MRTIFIVIIIMWGSASAQAFKDTAIDAQLPYILIGGGGALSNIVIDSVNIPSVGDLNDDVDFINVPPGYVLAAYEHINYKGKARLFFGSMDIDGDLSNEISSVKIRKYADLDCAIAFEHANYSGDAWPFCIIDGGFVQTDVTYWDDEISSVQVPHGVRLSFCGDVSDTPCRSYTANSNYVGHASNDQFNSVVLTKFDDTAFKMVIMSDPQLGWDGIKPDSLAIYTDDYSSDKDESWLTSATLQAVSMIPLRLPYASQNFAGVIVNGDITNTGDAWQIRKFDELFQSKFDNIYIGLGNHDYDNYITSSDNEYIFEWYERNITGLPGLLSYDMDKAYPKNGSRDKYTGSFAYSWDIGDVHFIQLNNYPSYQVRGNYDTEFDIRASLAWLEDDIRNNGQGKRIVMNMHSLFANAFNSAGCLTPCSPVGAIPANQPLDSNGNPKSLSESQRSSNTRADYREFQRLLGLARTGAKDNVVLVFAGHIHSWAGNRKDYYVDRDPALPNYIGSNPEGSIKTNGGNDIPVFFSGGAQYSKHLVVEFESDKIVVRTIDSRFGVATVVQNDTVLSTSPATVSTTRP